MPQTIQAFPIDSVVDHMASCHNNGVSLASSLLEALRKSGMENPDLENVKHITEKLEYHAAALLSLPQVSEVHGGNSFSSCVDDGAILIFEDLSACWFDAYGRLGDTELLPDTNNVNYGTTIPDGIFAQIIALSAGHINRYGAPEGNLYTGSDTNGHDYIQNLAHLLEDEIDPPIESMDELDPIQGFTEKDRDDLEDLVRFIWIGLQAPVASVTTIHSKTPETPAEVVIVLGGAKTDLYNKRLSEAFEECLRALDDLDRFTGYGYMSNGLASDRRSGFDIIPICVLNVEFDPAYAGISNHARISAPSKLRERLRQAGRSEDWINRILSFAPE